MAVEFQHASAGGNRADIEALFNIAKSASADGNRPDIEALFNIAKTETIPVDIFEDVERSLLQADKAAIVLYGGSIPPEFLVNPDDICRYRNGRCVLMSNTRLPWGLLPFSIGTNSLGHSQFLSRVLRLNELLKKGVSITILTRSENCPRQNGELGDVTVQAKSLLGRFREGNASGKGHVSKKPLKVIQLPEDIHKQIAKMTPARTYCWSLAGQTQTAVMLAIPGGAPESQRSYTRLPREKAAPQIEWVNKLLQGLREPTLEEQVAVRRAVKPRKKRHVDQAAKCEHL